MTTIANHLPTPLDRWTRRLLQTWRTFFAQGDFTALLITLALLFMPALSLNTAGWPLAMQTLIPVLVLSILFGFLLSRSYYNELLALMMSGIYGVCFILLIATINEPGGLADGAFSVFSRLFRWILDATTGGINPDDLVFTLLVSGLFWFLGYNIAWHVFRIDRVWRAIMPPGLILMTNSIYYNGSENLNLYIIIFMFLSLLLVVRSNLDAREWEWYVNGIRVPRKLRAQFLRVGAVLATIALLVGWTIPSGDLQDRLNKFQEFMQSEPLTQLSELWNRLFSSVEAQGPTTADYYGSDSLQLGGAIRLGDQMVFTAAAPLGRRYYWRSRVFDIYDFGRWTSAADTRLTDPESPLDIAHEPYAPGARTPIQQTFTMGLNASRIVYTAPLPVRVDLPTRTDLRYSPQPEGAMNISVIRPLKVLYRGDQYTVTSLVSSADAAQLNQAPAVYPDWIRNIYLPYSPSVSGRTIQLASQIISEAGAVTPYEKARAIETWLRANIEYNESIPQPPADRDPVDWLLFDLREGYCNYYASAMVVMLRSQGIPARMAAGFAQGEWDDTLKAFVVRERDAHTWVEVYFPGYGWVEFEPTSAQAPLDRGDDMPQFQQQPPSPPPPVVSSTPTLTPTPSITPTAGEPTVPPEPETNLFPTMTPTFTPSPTATPVIVPTQPPPLTPPPRGPFSFILPAIGMALLGLLALAVLAAIGFLIYWWWEWRGMKGLSPVSRAYARLERYLPLIGIRVQAQQTPDERRETIVRDLPAAEPPVSAITKMYISERYSEANRRRFGQNTPQGEMADKAWTDARGNILSRFVRRFIPFVKKK